MPVECPDPRTVTIPGGEVALIASEQVGRQRLILQHRTGPPVLVFFGAGTPSEGWYHVRLDEQSRATIDVEWDGEVWGYGAGKAAYASEGAMFEPIPSVVAVTELIKT